MPEKGSSLLAIGSAAALGSFVAFAFAYGAWDLWESAPETQAEGPACNVLALQIHGTIVGTQSQIPVSDYLIPDGSGTSYAPNYAIANLIVSALDAAREDEAIRAVMIDIDSPGGNSAASNEIADAIERLGKPSIAVIHDLGLSGGYLAAAAADSILANKNSTIGSIGATYSYISDVEKNEKEGLAYVALSSGPYKDMLSPSKTLTPDERALIEKDLSTLHADFVSTIARMRGISEEEVVKLADGSSLLGVDAFTAGLIDGFGSTYEATTMLAEYLGEPATICWQ